MTQHGKDALDALDDVSGELLSKLPDDFGRRGRQPALHSIGTPRAPLETACG